MPRAIPHTPNDLERLVQHIHYEYDHLQSALRGSFVLANTANPTYDAASRAFLGQSLLEVGLLHLRSLIEFLTSKPDNDHPTGVVADDYFDEPWKGKPNVVIGKDPAHQKEVMKEINGRLVHLSTRRLLEETPEGGFSWGTILDLVGPAAKVFDAFQAFRSDLADVHPQRGAWFDKYPFPL